MGVRDVWHRALVYFGLTEDDAYYDDEMTGTSTIDKTGDRSRPPARREIAASSRSEESEPVPRRRRSSAQGGTAVVDDRRGLRVAEESPSSGRRYAAKVHLIQPRSFNDAQQIADRFKAEVPVIVNLQTAEPELAKRLIDFGSGLTYALDGAMQRIAEKVFLLTPKNVEVSAEDRARLVEQGFFNPS